jgi:4-hydroxy-tetrahydrodipicolinate synthase
MSFREVLINPTCLAIESEIEMSFRGVFVATVTPFLEKNGEVDFHSYRTHVKRLIHSGVHGFVPCGTTGEGPCLSDSERRKLIEISCEEATPKNLKVIAGCGSNSTSNAFKMILEAKEVGADAALVVTPYYNKPTQEGLLAHYEFLADRSPIPLVLYHVPGRTQVSFQVPTLQRLFKHKNIIGMKEASGQFSFWSALSQAVDWTAKAIFAGDDDAFALIQQMGGQGIISATANVAPEAFVTLFHLTESGQWKEAFDLQKKWVPLIQAMFAETNPSPVKEALKAMGRMENTVRLPLVPVLSKTKEQIHHALRELGIL